jgi:fibronectin-binding autotransporter adhesin
LQNIMKSKQSLNRNSIHQITSLLFLSGALCLNAVAGNETWTGAAGDNNWNTGGNWTGDNIPPIAGDVITFSAQGAGGLTLNNNMTVDTTFQGLYFNATAPSFILTGNEITTTGATIDNSLNFETINQPITSTATHTFSAASGGTMLFGGVLSGTGAGINKTLGGTVILTNNNTYTGTTTVGAGTLILDFTGGASSILPSASALSMGGGTLNIKGSSLAASSQTFASTALNAGASVVSVVNNGAAPTLALGTITRNAGSGIAFYAGGVISVGGTTGILLGGNATPYGLITDANGNPTDYAAVNASGQIAAGQTVLPAGATGWEVPTTANQAISGTQPTGYWVFNNTTAGTTTLGANTTMSPFLYNTFVSGGWTFNVGSGSRTATMAHVAVVSGVGAANVTFVGPIVRVNGELVLDQYNTGGYLTINVATNLSSTGTGNLTKNGPGTVVMTAIGTYAGQTFLNGGNFVITNDNGLGAVATGANLNLNGGTIVGTNNFTMDNAGASLRAITLGGNGGGLAASARATP